MNEPIEKIIELDELFTTYGKLLNEKNRIILEEYLQEDLSLVEVAENLGITKQAVSSSIKRSQETLINFENNLSIIKNRKEINANIIDLEDILKLEKISVSNKSKISNIIQKIKLLVD